MTICFRGSEAQSSDSRTLGSRAIRGQYTYLNEDACGRVALEISILSPYLSRLARYGESLFCLCTRLCRSPLNRIARFMNCWLLSTRFEVVGPGKKKLPEKKSGKGSRHMNRPRNPNLQILALAIDQLGDLTNSQIILIIVTHCR